MSMYDSMYSACSLCPRMCKTDRLSGKLGVCRETAKIRLAWAGLHFGEEPIITGKSGSGTVFFTGCTLRCSFCQNYQISHEGLGREISTDELTDIFWGLQDMGAENINLVTGTHFIPSIVDSIEKARAFGLRLPIVWNTSGYETVEMVRFLSRYVDVFLTDLKTLSRGLSGKLFRASNYPTVAVEAISEMVRSKRVVAENGILKEGVIVRHLVLPGMLDSTFHFLNLFRKEWYGRAILSLMFQYMPTPYLASEETSLTSRVDIPSLKRLPSHSEYDTVMSYLDEIGIEEGFVHDVEEDSEWLPDFTKEKPFPPELCKPFWFLK